MKIIATQQKGSHDFYAKLSWYEFWISESPSPCRPDRDDSVKINWLNIEYGKYNNFEKKDAEDVSSFGEAYDYGSVMHYSRSGFSRNGEDTITPLV
jgi:hypothetical protein